MPRPPGLRALARWTVRTRDGTARRKGGARRGLRERHREGDGAAAGDGAKVALTDIQDELCEQAANAIRESGGTAFFAHQDVVEEDGWKAVVWATAGVRVNSVHPGFSVTPILDQAMGTEIEAGIASTPMGRLGRAEEVAAVVAFFASDDASFMTGSEVYVDGGFIAP